MSVLDASTLFSTHLPERHAAALDDMAELDALRCDEELPILERREVARSVYARALANSAKSIVAPAFAPTNASLIEAALLWLRFHEVGFPVLVDTLGSPSLASFPVDLPADGALADRVRAALPVAFGTSGDQIRSLERGIDHLTSNLGIKRAIARTLSAMAHERGWTSPAGRVAAMQNFYGAIPWRAGDVDVVITPASVFFCVPYRDELLETLDWLERPDADRARVGAFLARLGEGNSAETLRFPSFGAFNLETLDRELARELALRVDINQEVVLRTLSTMVSVLPTRRSEQYLVHDTWGHTWQEALTEFEWDYARVPQLSTALVSDKGIELVGSSARSIETAFVREGGRVRLDETAWLELVEADLRDRLQVAVSVALSELLADFIEAKFVRCCPELALPTSSLMDSASLKLDLTLGDVRRQVRRATKPWRALTGDAATRTAFGRALMAAGIPEHGLASAVDRASEMVANAFGPAFQLDFNAKRDAAGPRSSAGGRITLQLLAVAVELERVLARGARPNRSDPWLDPGSCPDLAAIAIGHFYEQDRRVNFWQLDRLMRVEFQQNFARLRDAMA